MMKQDTKNSPTNPSIQPEKICVQKNKISIALDKKDGLFFLLTWLTKKTIVITIEVNDGVVEVDRDTAWLCNTVRKQLKQNGQTTVISIPNVTVNALLKVLEWCRFHCPPQNNTSGLFILNLFNGFQKIKQKFHPQKKENCMIKILLIQILENYVNWHLLHIIWILNLLLI